MGIAMPMVSQCGCVEVDLYSWVQAEGVAQCVDNEEIMTLP
jgi:hypothetical protein